MASNPQAAPEARADGPTDLPPRTWKEIVLSAWRESNDDNLSLVSAGVAFYAFLAFVPLLTAFVLAYGLVAEPASVVGHVGALTRVMPENAAQIIGDQLMSLVEGEGAGKGIGLLVAIGIALYGATKGATSIMTALNIAYDVSETRGFIAKTLVSFAMTAGAVLALFLAILALSALHFVERLLPATGGAVHFLVQATAWALAAGAVIALLAAIYRYGPNRPDAPWRWITPGSVFATAAWLAATLGFGFYVSNFGNYNATYGSLGAVIVFLTWLYLSAYIVLLGAELNSEIETRVARGGAAAPAAEEAPQAAAPDPRPGAGELALKWGALALLLRLLGQPQRQRAIR